MESTSLLKVWDGDLLAEVFASGARGFTKRCGTYQQALGFLQEEAVAWLLGQDPPDTRAVDIVHIEAEVERLRCHGRELGVPEGTGGTLFEIDGPEPSTAPTYFAFSPDGLLLARGRDKAKVLSGLTPDRGANAPGP